MNELLQPLEKESRTGCQNASVFGGFHVFILDSLEKLSADGTSLEPALQKTISELKNLFKDYSERSSRERKLRIERAKELLDIMAKPAPPPKPIDPLEFAVQYVKNVGPHIAQKLERLGIQTVRDLFSHYPRRHEDRRHLCSLREAVSGEMQTIRGKIRKVTEFKPKRQFVITKMTIEDGTAAASLLWYNQSYLKNILKPGLEVIVYGKLENKYGERQIVNPEFEILSEDQEVTLHTNRIVPIYSSTESLSQTLLRKIIFNALERHQHEMADTLPAELKQEYKLAEYQESMQSIHFPSGWDQLKIARRRLVFEEFFYLQLFLALKKRRQETPQGIAFAIPPEWVQEFESKLPFQLTAAQKRVMGEMASDMREQKTMHRLLQGDVGSGKTVVAAFGALAAIRCGYQAAYMAPTEILAEQHGATFSKILGAFEIPVIRLIGDQTKTERDRALRALQSGSAKMVIGTHALIQEDVFFHKLGFCVIDEQHKFGVMQRTSLRQKGNHPDILVMTATPIPRTLAMTLYGDLDISVIDEMPVGRKPVKTAWIPKNQKQRAWNFIRKEVSEGKQAFIVCPLVEESDKIFAASAVREAERLAKEVFSDIPVACLHGKIKSEEKERIMTDFRDKKLKVLIATTVIEVGVDIPNASVMVIQNAERFGLSQLHQLRGRVGRSDAQAYCILLADTKGEEAVTRLQALCQSNDGFSIAEQDLRLRGPGEFYGTRQHGLPDLKIADLLRDGAILEEARQAAFKFISEDPNLSKKENEPLRSALHEKFGNKLELI